MQHHYFSENRHRGLHNTLRRILVLAFCVNYFKSAVLAAIKLHTFRNYLCKRGTISLPSLVSQAYFRQCSRSIIGITFHRHHKGNSLFTHGAKRWNIAALQPFTHGIAESVSCQMIVCQRSIAICLVWVGLAFT